MFADLNEDVGRIVECELSVEASKFKKDPSLNKIGKKQWFYIF